MRQINLREYVPSEHELSKSELDAIIEVLPSVTVKPLAGSPSKYLLTPGSTVGAAEFENLSVLIRPKIGIPQLLSLACYATGVYRPDADRFFNFKEQDTLPDTLAVALSIVAKRALANGILHGYRTEEDSFFTIRGRIKFEDQIRRRFDMPLPVEVQYDDFTDDILANRLIKAATYRIARMRIRSSTARRGLAWIESMLAHVSPLEIQPHSVPEIQFNKLNEHYREVVGLSRLILRHAAFGANRGDVRTTGFLIDMNVLFQEFVTHALREILLVSSRVLCSDKSIPRRVTLDQVGNVTLKPDLSWWEQGACTFVGDAKYKKIDAENVPNADLYQLLAYVTALNLPGGVLVYAKGEVEPITYQVRYSDIRLEVSALDLAGDLNQVLARVKFLADKVLQLREVALSSQRVA